MNRDNGPDLAVVFVVPDRFDDIRKTLEHLQAQTVRDCLELVLVTPSLEHLHLDEQAVAGFRAVNLVETGGHLDTGPALALGFCQASTPIVVMGEEHSYPEPGWAEALIAAHRGPWAAVGAAIINANPESALSWANLFLSFGHSVEPQAGGEATRLACHNTSYKRAILLEMGPSLPSLTTSEDVLFQELRARGGRLYLEAAARTHHVNVSNPLSFMKVMFVGGQIFGSIRVTIQRWSLARRALYAVAAPFIGLARLRSLGPLLLKAGRHRARLPNIFAAVVVGLFLHGLGESAAYAFGPGTAAKEKFNIEHHRLDHIQQRERQALSSK